MGNELTFKKLFVAIGCLSLFSASSFAQTTLSPERQKIEDAINKSKIQRDVKKERALDIRCYLGKETSQEKTYCTGFLAKQPNTVASKSADCTAFNLGSLARQQCELGKKIAELQNQVQTNKSISPNDLFVLKQQKDQIDKDIKVLEKESDQILKELGNIDKEIAKLEDQKKKSDALLQAEAKYKSAREEYYEKSGELPKEATADERKKFLATEEKKISNAARDLYKAKNSALSGQKTKTSESYAGCIGALSSFDPSKPIDLAAACSSQGPAGTDYVLASGNTPEAKDARNEILAYVEGQKEKELAALKEAQTSAYSDMMTYADNTKECGYSEQAGSSWACEVANKSAEYGTLAAVAAQQVGNVSLQLQGGKNLQRLNPDSGFSDMYETGAKNADSAAETSNILKYATGAVAAAQTLAGATALTYSMADPNLQGDAAKEHRDAGMKAVMSGVASGALAYQYQIQEDMAKNEANALRKIRDGYKGLEGLEIGKNPDPLADRGGESPFQNPFADMESSKQGANSDFMTPEQYGSNASSDTPPPSLGEPINAGGGSGNGGGGNTPAPVANVGGGGSGGGSGGGGFFGGSGGGSGSSVLTPTADDGSAENAHQYAGIMNNPNRYSSGSGGGAGAKGGAPAGVDLSSMLAKFLPGFGKKDDGKDVKKGILEFGKKANRQVAGATQGGRYDQDLNQVDRKRSLFDRVHMAYQIKQKENSI